MTSKAVPAPAAPAPVRRKACDLCFTKKIKCDMLKPVCSNCILYSAECRTTGVARRKAGAGVVKSRSVKAKLDSTEEENESLRAKLARIEEQLAQVLEGAKNQHVWAQASASASSTSPDETSTQSCSTTSEELKSSEWKFDPIEPVLYSGPADEGLPLPPLDRILPVVDHYFSTFNQLSPLFDQQVFMRVLTGWYNHSIKRDRATWASILIVCAMGLRSPAPGEHLSGETAEKTEWANYCMRNAQSVMSELVTREEDLLGLQVLIGLVQLFLNSSDPRAASVLIGTAVRLALRMQLHSSNSEKYFASYEILQRNRVFWIAYTLDKDISLRTKAPACQSDLDIDISLPPLIPPDGLGMIWSDDGQTSFNHFRMRLDLAHIEGKIYDMLYSNRSLKIQPPERQKRVASLSAMLEQWYSRVPTAFRIEHVLSTVDDKARIQLIKMHHSYLMSIVHIHGVYSHQAEWIGRVSSLSRASIREFAVNMQGHSTQCGSDIQNPPMKEGWDHCVDVSRECLKLFQDSTPTECLIWSCSCAHFSGLIILMANSLMSPSHTNVDLDQQITNKGVRLFNGLMEVIQAGAFYETLRQLINDLHRTSNKAVDAARLELSIGNESFVGPDLDSFGEEIGFPEFIDANDEGMRASLEMNGLFDPFFSPGGEEGNSNSVALSADFHH